MADYVSEVDLNVAVPSPQSIAYVSEVDLNVAVPSPQSIAYISFVGLTVAVPGVVATVHPIVWFAS